MKGSIKKFIVVVLSMVLSVSLTNVMLPAENNVAVVEAATKTPKLNKTKVTLIKGKTVQLKLSNSKNVKWSSSKKSVATVSKSGKVSAKKKGTAVISAKYKGKTYKCTVTVEIPKLNKTDLVLVEGEQYTLKVSGTKQKVSWSISNKKVATVKNGVVTAKSLGNAKITAKVGTSKYVCYVYVDEKVVDEEPDEIITKPDKTPVVVPVESLVPSQTELSMTKGQSQAITVSALPSNTTETLSLSYVSSNSAVATVDGNGNITAVGGGNTIITISHGSVSTAVKVNVSVPITGISLDKTSMSIAQGKTETLIATINPADTTDNKAIIWSSSDNSIATVNNGVITGIKEGTVIITAKTTNGFSAVCQVNVLNLIDDNIAMLKQKIKTEGGTYSSDGKKFITYVMTTSDYTIIYSIEYDEEKDSLTFTNSSSYNSSRINARLEMNIDEIQLDSVVVNFTKISYKHGLKDVAVSSFAASKYFQDFNENVPFSLVSGSGRLYDEITTNMELKGAFMGWNILLKEKVGISLADIGFLHWK